MSILVNSPAASGPPSSAFLFALDEKHTDESFHREGHRTPALVIGSYCFAMSESIRAHRSADSVGKTFTSGGHIAPLGRTDSCCGCSHAAFDWLRQRSGAWGFCDGDSDRSNRGCRGARSLSCISKRCPDFRSPAGVSGRRCGLRQPQGHSGLLPGGGRELSPRPSRGYGLACHYSQGLQRPSRTLRSRLAGREHSVHVLALRLGRRVS